MKNGVVQLLPRRSLFATASPTLPFATLAAASPTLTAGPPLPLSSAPLATPTTLFAASANFVVSNNGYNDYRRYSQNKKKKFGCHSAHFDYLPPR
jgi:hypothetical protein